MGKKNHSLLIRRNEKLVQKFFELYEIKRMRVDDVLRELSYDHFFISEKRIYQLLFYDKSNQQKLDTLIKKRQNSTQLKLPLDGKTN